MIPTGRFTLKQDMWKYIIYHKQTVTVKDVVFLKHNAHNINSEYKIGIGTKNSFIACQDGSAVLGEKPNCNFLDFVRNIWKMTCFFTLPDGKLTILSFPSLVHHEIN